MYLRLVILTTLMCLIYGHVLHKVENGDINVSQSASAIDKEGCGTTEMPCRTLPYAAQVCQSSTCSFVIDGGADKLYAYILNGNDTFSVGGVSVRVTALPGSDKPVIVCNKTGRAESCFEVNGGRIGILVDGLEFVSTGADDQSRGKVSTRKNDLNIRDAKPMLVLSGGPPGSSVSNCDFHDITMNIRSVSNIQNWFMTGSQVTWQQNMPTTMQGCNLQSCNFQIEGGPPLNMNGTRLIETTFDVTAQ